jgi:hypothetical protein
MPGRVQLVCGNSLLGCPVLTFRSLCGGPCRRAINRRGAILFHSHNCCLDIECCSVRRWKFRIAVKVSPHGGRQLNRPA